MAGGLGIILLISACISATAQDVAFDYDSHPQTFKVCQLRMPDPPGTPPPGPAPPVPTAGPLDDLVAPGSPLSRGWRLENPLQHPNSLLNPPTASPWFAVLDPGSVARLSEYDLVLLSAAELADLITAPNAPALLDALKAICDAGAVVWIDGAGGLGPPPFGPVIDPSFVSFATADTGGGSDVIDMPVGPPWGRASHPLVRTPFRLAAPERALLCPGGGGSLSIAPDSSNVLHAVVGDAASLPVSLTTPTIAAGQYGSGAVVISASNIFGTLGGPETTSVERVAKRAAQKFACNVLAWSQRWSTESAVPRHLGYVNFTVQPPLSIAWQFPSPLIPRAAFSIAPIRSSVVVDRGIAFVATSPPVGGNGTVYALDLNPARDLDGDGLTDDGIRDLDGNGVDDDYSVGAPHDVLWQTPRPGDPPLPGTPVFAASCAALRNVRTGGNITGLEHVVLVSTLAPPDAGVICLRAADGTQAWSQPAVRNPGPDYAIIWISSPVAHQGFVYFLTQEYNAGAATPSEQYYTRVHAIDLDSGGATSAWVYPDPNITEPDTLIPPVIGDADGDGDIDAADVALVPGPAPCISATASRADGRLLDAVVRFGTVYSFASDTDPDPTTPIIGPPVDGGSEFAIVPTPPANGPVTRPPNLGYYRVRLSTASDPTTVTLSNTYQDDGSTAIAGIEWPGGGDVRGVEFDQTTARTYLLDEVNLPAGASSSDPIGWQEGRDVVVEYDTPGPDLIPGTADDVTVTETLFLHGPVLWKRRFGVDGVAEVRVASTTVDGSTALAATINDPANGPAILHGFRAEDRDAVLGYIPGLLGITWVGTPAAGEGTAYLLESSASAATPWTALTAITMHPDLSIRIRGIDPPAAPADAWIVPGSVQILLVDPNPPDLLAAAAEVVDPQAYSVDAQAHVITFDPTFISPLDRADTTDRRRDYWDVAGKAVDVSCQHDGGPPSNRTAAVGVGPDRYVVPDVRRYQTAPGLIKLRYPPADANADGIPDDVNGDGNPDFDIHLAGIVPQPPDTLVTGWVLDPDGDGLLDGVVDLTGAVVGLPASPLLDVGELLGHEVDVYYVGYSEYDEGVVFCGVPPAGATVSVLPPERHYVPDRIGPSLSSPTVTGNTFHAGTEANPANASSTAWSGTWDNRTTSVRTTVSQPAVPHGTYPTDDPTDPDAGRTLALRGAPAAAALPLEPIGPPGFLGTDTSPGQPGTPDLHFLLYQNSLPIAPSLNANDPLVVLPTARNALVAGCRAPGDPANPVGSGFVSALLPANTLMADGTRILEVKGTDVDWECIASRSHLPGQSYESLRPFTRAAKVKVLDPHHNIRVFSARHFPCDPNDVRTGMETTASHLLVVDTANNRVVEIDRVGNVIWPLAARGMAFEEVDLGLNAPTDAYRWVSVEEDRNGDGTADPDEDYNGNGRFDLVYHTLIADAGNSRIVDFKTYVAVHPDPAAAGAPPFDTTTIEHFSNHPTPTHLDIDLDPSDDEATPTTLARVEYSHAVPIFHPTDGSYIGVLCAARNLNRLIVIDVTTDPPTPFPLAKAPPVTGADTRWRWLAWLYDRNLDGVNDDPLLFDGIKDLRLLPAPHGDSRIDTDGDGAPDTLFPMNGRGRWPEGGVMYLTITCSGYRNPPLGVGAIHEPGAIEFAVDASDPTAPVFIGPTFDPAIPPSGGMPSVAAGTPHWRFTRVDYFEAGATPGPDDDLGTPDDGHPYATLADAGPDGIPNTGDEREYQKPWRPTSCHRLEDGTHVIVNGAAQPRHVTRANFPAQDTNFSEIIQVLTDYTVAPLTLRRHFFGRSELIPDPNAAPWNERLSQPAYVQRY